MISSRTSKDPPGEKRVGGEDAVHWEAAMKGKREGGRGGEPYDPGLEAYYGRPYYVTTHLWKLASFLSSLKSEKKEKCDHSSVFLW